MTSFLALSLRGILTSFHTKRGSQCKERWELLIVSFKAWAPVIKSLGITNLKLCSVNCVIKLLQFFVLNKRLPIILGTSLACLFINIFICHFLCLRKDSKSYISHKKLNHTFNLFTIQCYLSLWIASVLLWIAFCKMSKDFVMPP